MILIVLYPLIKLNTGNLFKGLTPCLLRATLINGLGDCLENIKKKANEILYNNKSDLKC